MILTRGNGHAINQEMFHVSNKLSGYKNRRPYLKDNVELFHCVKSLQIWSFSGPYFPVFVLNTEVYGRIQYEYRKIRTRKNPVFGNFSRSDLLIH